MASITFGEKSRAKLRTPDFDAALAKARVDTSHIFQEALQNRKDAAKAWHKRSGGIYGSDFTIANLPFPPRLSAGSSRFKAVAFESECIKESSWDPCRNSLFDPYELISVGQDLDRAVNGPGPFARPWVELKKMRFLSKLFSTCRTLDVIEPIVIKRDQLQIPLRLHNVRKGEQILEGKMKQIQNKSLTSFATSSNSSSDSD